MHQEKPLRALAKQSVGFSANGQHCHRRRGANRKMAAL